MNYINAIKLLDEVKNGHNHPESEITTALELTGDLEPEICTDGIGWWGSITEGWAPRLPFTKICRTGSGFSGFAINDSRTD
jgi:hypothetical protein